MTEKELIKDYDPSNKSRKYVKYLPFGAQSYVTVM